MLGRLQSFREDAASGSGCPRSDEKGAWPRGSSSDLCWRFKRRGLANRRDPLVARNLLILLQV